MPELHRIRTNLKVLDEEGKWLFDAAIAEASQLPLIDLDLGQVTNQLVLVRYSTQVDSDGLPRRLRWKFGAMWTNLVTGVAARTADITGANRAEKWAALNVVRIGLPDGFCIPNHNEDGDGPLRYGQVKDGREYFLDCDVRVGQFATIPIQLCPMKKCLIAGGPMNRAFSMRSWLPANPG